MKLVANGKMDLIISQIAWNYCRIVNLYNIFMESKAKSFRKIVFQE